MNRLSISLFSAALACASISSVSHAESLVMGIADCIEHGLANHPELIRARIAIEMSRQRLIASQAYSDPRLALSLGYEDTGLPVGGSPFFGGAESLVGLVQIDREFSRGTVLSLSARRSHFDYGVTPFGVSDVHTGELRASVSQPLLRNAWGRQSRLNALVHLDLLEQSRLLLDDVASQYALQVHEAYADAFAAHEWARLDRESLDRLSRLHEANQGYARDKLVDEAEALASEAGVAVKEAECIVSKNAAISARDRVLSLIALPVERWDLVKLDFSHMNARQAESEDPKDAFSTAMQHRADWLALEKARKSAMYEIARQRDLLRPQLSVTAHADAGDSGEDASDAYGLDQTGWGLGVAFLLNWHNTAEKAALRQAELVLEGIESDQEQLRRLIYAECRAAARDLAAASRQIVAAERALTLQKRKLAEELRRQEQGRSSARFVLLYEEDVQVAERRRIQALAEMERRWALYAAALGSLVRGEP